VTAPVARIVLLVTSPRIPSELLTAAAWDLVRAHPVLAAAPTPVVETVRAAGATVAITGPDPAAVLTAVAEHGTVVWLAGPDGDQAFARELGLLLAREPGRAELELMYGSWDPPGARLLDVVEVLDRLASPGGDQWLRQKAELGPQAHQRLAHYLLEEAYEAYDALDAQDPDAIREEFGDVLFQVVLHARLAAEGPRPWTIDDLAGELVAKLVRRNPHVFSGESVSGVEEIMANWERIKRAEKSRRSAMDGVALGQPALALTSKILSRAEQREVVLDVPAPPDPLVDEDSLGQALFALVAAARAAGLDAEAALRRTALRQAEAVRAAGG
jgi:XTP/dITP diphosphohydrolase